MKKEQKNAKKKRSFLPHPMPGDIKKQQTQNGGEGEHRDNVSFYFLTLFRKKKDSS